MLTLYIADVERDVGMKKLSRKEAAKVLEDMKVKIEIPKAAVTQWKRNTALDMAIEALKYSGVPNSSDSISRRAAIDAARDWYKGLICGSFNGLEKRLRALPSAQQWIPCSSALPKTEEIVLVTCEHLDIYGKPHRYVCKAFHVDRYTMRSDVGWWDEGCDEYREEDDQYYVLEGWYEYIHNWGDYSSVSITDDKVIAWMPLPEPWEGEKDE